MHRIATSLRPRKRFGQNFLNDQQVIDELVRLIHPQHQDNMVEIGPGLGALTFALLPQLDQLDVIELDRDLAAGLREHHDEKLIVHEQDVLQFDFTKLSQPNKKIRVVGNLPYNISTPILFHLLTYSQHIADMHFMLQKEVVDRLAAQPGNKDYGRLSVMIQYACQVQSLMRISPHAFYPEPKVVSAFVRLVPHVKLTHQAKDFARFSRIVQQAFNQRRKTLRNSLKELVSLEQFEQANIDPGARAEQLSVSDFVRLANLLTGFAGRLG